MMSLEEALLKKYLDPGDKELDIVYVSDPLHPPDHSALFSHSPPTNECGSPSRWQSFVIFAPPPMEKLPPVVAINDCEISDLGNLHRLKQLCAGVRELDLAHNQISNIQEVFHIVNSISHLSFLNLSQNDLSCMKAESRMLRLMASMRRLALNNTHVEWSTVADLVNMMPNLEELYLCLNEFTSVELCEIVCNSLKTLHISNNPIDRWEYAMALGQAFPLLETLYMVDCNLTTFGLLHEIRQTFKELTTLNLSNNNLRDWNEIDALNFFPKLDDARLQGLPFLEDYTQHERRQFLISRLPFVRRLNGSCVSDEEREDAERAFIRYYMNKDDKPSRYYELEAKHGKLDPLVEVDLAPQLFANVDIQFQDRTESRVISLTQTFAEFKASLHSLTQLASNRLRVFYVDTEVDYAPEEMRFLSKKLYSYHIKDGDRFIVDERL